MYLVFPVIVHRESYSECSLQCLSLSFGQNLKVNIAKIAITMTGKIRYKVGPLVNVKSSGR